MSSQQHNDNSPPATVANPEGGFRISLTTKFVGLVALVTVCIYPSLSYWAVTSNGVLLEEQFYKRARATAQLLDAMMTSKATLEDEEHVFNHLQRVLWLEPDVLGIDISLRREGELVVATST